MIHFPRTFFSHMCDMVLFFIDIIYQTSGLYDFLHKGWKSLPLKFCSLCAVVDSSAVKIHFHLVSIFDGAGRFRTLNNRKSDIDRISIENPCKSLCNHTADPRSLDGNRRMFSRGAAAEVLVCHNNITFVDFLHKFRVNVCHAVPCQLCGVRRIQIPGGNNHVCIYVVTILKNCSICPQFPAPPVTISAGADIFPVTALAAATAGLARYTSDST